MTEGIKLELSGNDMMDDQLTKKAIFGRYCYYYYYYYCYYYCYYNYCLCVTTTKTEDIEVKTSGNVDRDTELNHNKLYTNWFLKG